MEEDFSWFYQFLLKKFLFVFRQSMFFFVLFVPIFIDYPLWLVYSFAFATSFVLELIGLIILFIFCPTDEENTSK